MGDFTLGKNFSAYLFVFLIAFSFFLVYNTQCIQV